MFITNIFKFALECVITWGLTKQENLKPNWTHRCLVYSYNVGLMGKNMRTKKKSTEA